MTYTLIGYSPVYAGPVAVPLEWEAPMARIVIRWGELQAEAGPMPLTHNALWVLWQSLPAEVVQALAADGVNERSFAREIQGAWLDLPGDVVNYDVGAAAAWSELTGQP